MYSDTVFLTEDGTVLSIASVKKSGLAGESLMSKFLSALTGTFNIEVVLDDVGPTVLDDFRQMVVEALRIDSSSGEPVLGKRQSLEAIEAAVRHASSSKEIFVAIGLPNDQDCLDSL